MHKGMNSIKHINQKHIYITPIILNDNLKILPITFISNILKLYLKPPPSEPDPKEPPPPPPEENPPPPEE